MDIVKLGCRCGTLWLFNLASVDTHFVQRSFWPKWLRILVFFSLYSRLLADFLRKLKNFWAGWGPCLEYCSPKLMSFGRWLRQTGAHRNMLSNKTTRRWLETIHSSSVIYSGDSVVLITAARFKVRKWVNDSFSHLTISPPQCHHGDSISCWFSSKVHL